MTKDPPKFPQILAMVVFALSCFGLLLFLWLSFGGPIPLKPKGYQVKVAFQDATTLAEQADVRVAGVSVGKVVSKERAPGGNATLATLEVEDRYAPLRSDARAILRQKTLLGETYVELTTGTRGAAPLPEDGRLPDGRVAQTVELDEVLEIFPEQTREAFRRWQANGAATIEGRSEDLNAALGNLPGFAEGGAELFEVLDRRREGLRALVRETGVVFEALTRDEDQLRAFIVDSARWLRATQSQREALAESIRVFPTFLDESKATLARLETFARDTDPLVLARAPGARDLQPTLRDLRALAPDLRATFEALPALVTASRSGLPALRDVLRGLEPTLAATWPMLAQLNPLLQWLEINQGKSSDFLSVGPSALASRQATPNRNGNGHALPQIITTGSQSIITPTRSADNRGNTYAFADALVDPRYKQGFNTLPSWDCANVGGERPASPDAGDDQPGCYVLEPIEFQGRTQRFPRITQSMP